METSTDVAGEVVDLCRDLIRIDTSNYGSQDGPGERKAAEYVATRLDEVGVAAEIIETAPGRANVLARWGGDGNGDRKNARVYAMAGFPDLLDGKDGGDPLVADEALELPAATFRHEVALDAVGHERRALRTVAASPEGPAVLKDQNRSGTGSCYWRVLCHCTSLPVGLVRGSESSISALMEDRSCVLSAAYLDRKPVSKV